MSFREHASSCPDGQPPDGSRRLDLCPDFNTFPVSVGHSERDRAHLDLSAQLTACLRSWAQEWEDNISAAHSPDKLTMDHWLSQYDDLAAALAAETGATVASRGLIDLPDEDCPHCGDAAILARAEARQRTRPDANVPSDRSQGWHPYT